MQNRDKYQTFPQGAELFPVWHKHFIIGKMSPVPWSSLSVLHWLAQCCVLLVLLNARWSTKR